MLPWASKLPWDIIYAASTNHQLDPALVAAITQTESAGLPFSTRFEPAYAYLWNVAIYAKKTRVTYQTEMQLQKFSWGLMQVMGAVARQFGFEGYLPELCGPELGIEYGCRYLNKLFKEYSEITDVIASYNAGHPHRDAAGKYINQEYVDRVLGYLKNG